MTARSGLLLAPGAGADRDAPTLVALDRAATAAGWKVARMDFPYRRAGRRAPDRAPVLLDAVRAEAADLAADCDRMVLGGRSMGGRICSMAVAEGVAAVGLLLVSYPLHPPGRPDRLRTGHFPAIEVPCLFISGRRDAFARPGELEEVTEAIPAPVTIRWIDGKDHGLKGVDDVVCALALEWMRSLEPPADG